MVKRLKKQDWSIKHHRCGMVFLSERNGVLIVSDDNEPMEIVETHASIDTLLEQWRPSLGGDYAGYRCHLYRVFNFSLGLSGASGEDREKLAVAAAFHDIGIWLDGTFDYLDPSSRRAVDYLTQNDHEDWTDTVREIIEQHHKVYAWRGNPSEPVDKDTLLVESFRQADWLDVCLFALPTRLERRYLADVLRRFPRNGFHRRLVTLTLGWVKKHPTDPLPIFKW
jgi:hypothetical protein